MDERELGTKQIHITGTANLSIIGRDWAATSPMRASTG